jgi:hypothetical protein
VLVCVGDPEQRCIVVVLLLHQLRGKALLVFTVRTSVVQPALPFTCMHEWKFCFV